LRVTTPRGTNAIKKRFTLRGDRRSQCGPFELKLRVWDRDAGAIKSLADEMGVGTRELRQDINAIGGVNVYRDRFRILPYGEAGNDWIGLDARRVQNPTLRLSNNQVSGYVFISAESNPQLVDQSNREGLFENQAARDLRELLMHAIAEIETARYDVRPRRESSREATGDDSQGRGGLFDGFTLAPVRRAAETLYPKDDTLRRAIDDSQRELDEGISRVKNVLSRYQRLATLGSLVDHVLHEGRQPVARIRYNMDDIRTEIERATAETLPVVVPRILDHLVAMDKNADLLSAIFRKLDPFSGRQRGRPRDVVLEDEIRSAVALVQHELDEVGASISLPSSRTTVRVDPADIQIIIRNLVQNSAYWLKEVPRGKRDIVIELERPSDGVVDIMVSDSGPGVAEEDREKIWLPYFTRKPDGTGLGLMIVGEIVQDFYGGELRLAEGPLPGATFTVTLKRRVG
ncbi:MAG: ATP-binding protein, partial [Polyangiaceae bacterium]